MERSLVILTLCIGQLANAQLQNTDFEQWLNPITAQGNDNLPLGWMQMNPFVAQPDMVLFNPPSTTAASGTHAVTLSVHYHYTKDRLFQTAPNTTRPTELRGWYTYTENVLEYANEYFPDSALVEVVLTRWNPLTTQRDTIGQGHVGLGERAEFGAFSVPIIYINNDQPDSIHVLLDPSKCRRAGPSYSWQSYPEPNCSFFTVDALELVESSTGVDEMPGLRSITVYPNPACGIVFLPGAMDGHLFDAEGREVLAFRRANTIDVSGLGSGVYTLCTASGRSTRILVR